MCVVAGACDDDDDDVCDEANVDKVAIEWDDGGKDETADAGATVCDIIADDGCDAAGGASANDTGSRRIEVAFDAVVGDDDDDDDDDDDKNDDVCVSIEFGNAVAGESGVFFFRSGIFDCLSEKYNTMRE